MAGAYLRSDALNKYRRNVSKAQMADLLSLVTGEDTDLIRYDEVAKRLKARQEIALGTQNVPLDQIVGSVGRYHDFTRRFLPRSNVSAERWSGVDVAMNGFAGLPPVDLYKLGDTYFVRDGNHRISVARANGVSSIEAYVTEVQTPISLTVADFERDAWLIKIEQAEFMEDTHLDAVRPDHGVELTEPGRYAMLQHHIDVHQYFEEIGREKQGLDSYVSREEAVAGWYDHIYTPVVEAIRTYNLLRNFPGRTEADLYLWITHHRERLAARYRLAPLSPEASVTTFVEIHAKNPLQRTVKGLQQSWWKHRRNAALQPPAGMSDDEFYASRARHAAGEISLGEVERLTASGENEA